MSHKVDLTDIKRDGDVSLTQQLIDRFTHAIDDGTLEPGEKLPTTRALAAEAGVNHLTAARVYRRLAELGYVTATVGRGTFVRTLAPAAVEERGDDWQLYALPDRPLSYSEEILGEAMRLTGDPDVISLASAWPAPDLYPIEALAEITARVFEDHGTRALDYLTADGLFELREQLALRGRKGGFAHDPDEIIVTNGARQGLDIATRALLDPGDVAVVETPTFAGTITSLRQTGARVIGIRYGNDGLDLDALEQVLARHEIKVLVTQTQCQNPTGRDMPAANRQRLARLAVERNFFIVEDGVYVDLRYEGEPQPSLRTYAPAHTIFLSSLSKSVGGGLRIGWIAGRGPVMDRLARLKMDSDLHTPTLTQFIAAEFLMSGGYERQLALSIPHYRERRDALLDSLDRHLAGEYTTAIPNGGHNLWVRLNRPVDDRALYSEALRHGMTFTPGGAVTAERPFETNMRLSFSLLDPPQLDDGVKRLARALREVRRRDRRAATVPLS
jgi:2-aminoadipate transaminase